MQNLLRRGASLLCCLALLLSGFLPAALTAEAAESTVPYIQQMLQYYRYYQDDAEAEIQELLNYIAYLDPQQGALWDSIMASWSFCNSEMEISANVLPDGLAQDDSLCIVVLGYALNSDGSMQPELVGRLETALRSAKKYPNAYIAVTGGGTAANADITEAEAMASWLLGNGIHPDRLILETKSLSTTYNAVNTYGRLVRSYPSVRSIALISSDYHLAWGSTLFQTVCDYTEVYGSRVIPVAACAAYVTGSTVNTMYYQTKGICTITGIPFPDTEKPILS